jgi:hypothetical protein
VFFKESNKDLINSIDEVEKTLHDIERWNMMNDLGNNSNSESSQSKLTRRKLTEENLTMKRDL